MLGVFEKLCETVLASLCHGGPEESAQFCGTEDLLCSCLEPEFHEARGGFRLEPLSLSLSWGFATASRSLPPCASAHPQFAECPSVSLFPPWSFLLRGSAVKKETRGGSAPLYATCFFNIPKQPNIGNVPPSSVAGTAGLQGT